MRDDYIKMESLGTFPASVSSTPVCLPILAILNTVLIRLLTSPMWYTTCGVGGRACFDLLPVITSPLGRFYIIKSHYMKTTL